MPEIQAFRGVRYNLGRVGSLSDVVTPPYDVIDAELQDYFYKLHPNNFIRIDLNRIEPGDDDERNNRYTRAAKFYKQWRDEGVLTVEADPAVYVYHQEFTAEGRKHVRRGFLARQRLSRFGEGQVFPHEETLPGAKADRLMLTVVTKTQLQPASSASIPIRSARPKTCWTTPSPARRRWWPPTIWAWSIGSGRSPTSRSIAKLAALMGPEADVHRRRPPPLRDRLQLSRPGLRQRLPLEGPSGQLHADDVRGDGRSGHDRHAHPPAVPHEGPGGRRQAG